MPTCSACKALDMNLELTEDQELFRQTTARFLASESPVGSVRDRHRAGDQAPPDWWRTAADLGWTSMLVGEAAGGGSLSGQPLGDAAIIAEEMGRTVSPGPFLPVNVVGTALSEAGTAEQQTRVLPALLAGDGVATWAFGERANRWDVAALTTTAEVRAGEVYLDGAKAYVEAATAAEHFLVTARSGDGVTQVLVAADTPGVSVAGASSLDLARRFGEVRFDAVRLPLDALVGEPGGAAAHVERQWQVALVLQSAETVGALGRVFEFTLEYMHDRFAFGRPISSYQALKHRVADLLLELESARAAVDAAVRAVDARDDDAAIQASVAKAYVGDRALHLIQECMQFHGGISVTWEHDLHLYLRRATVNRAVFGTPEQHRERICSLLEVAP
jgi:alkylation response protein AidB-like acyl-CoA dehydrogenase